MHCSSFEVNASSSLTTFLYVLLGVNPLQYSLGIERKLFGCLIQVFLITVVEMDNLMLFFSRISLPLSFLHYIYR